MLRRDPTSVTLTATDIEIFKELVRQQELQAQQQALAQAQASARSPEQEFVDDVFMGRSISKKRDLQTRLGIEEEDEDEDIEEPLYKKLNMST
jgi:hypothetical protein